MNDPNKSASRTLWIAFHNLERYLQSGLSEQLRNAVSFSPDDAKPFHEAYTTRRGVHPFLDSIQKVAADNAIETAQNGLNQLMDALREVPKYQPSDPMRAEAEKSASHVLNVALQDYRNALDEFAATMSIDTAKPNRRNVLFVSADPTDASRLKIQQEIREVEQELAMSEVRESAQIRTSFATRPKDLSRKLLELPRPNILHFSGHGSKTFGELCLENDFNETIALDSESISFLLKPISEDLECVVLNSCYSDSQTRQILVFSDHVIAMDGGIPDDSAIAFSIGFYQAIFATESIENSFELGCGQIAMLNSGDQSIPKLFSRSDV